MTEFLAMIFTFHYVSISTLIMPDFQFSIVDLHSTMYLFQRR